MMLEFGAMGVSMFEFGLICLIVFPIVGIIIKIKSEREKKKYLEELYRKDRERGEKEKAERIKQ